MVGYGKEVRALLGEYSINKERHCTWHVMNSPVSLIVVTV